MATKTDLGARAIEERTVRIAKAKAALDEARRAMADATRGAAMLVAERDRLNAGTPAGSPEAFAERWRQIAALEGALEQAAAWRRWWQPKIDQLDAAYRQATSSALPAFEQAAAAELAPLQAEMERWRSHPMRGRADVQQRYQEAQERYDAAMNRWRAAWNNRPQE